jgi:hypothetical protein
LGQWCHIEIKAVGLSGHSFILGVYPLGVLTSQMSLGEAQMDPDLNPLLL